MRLAASVRIGLTKAVAVENKCRKRRLAAQILKAAAIVYTTIFTTALTVRKIQHPFFYPEKTESPSPPTWKAQLVEAIEFLAVWGWVGVPIAAIFGCIGRCIEKSIAGSYQQKLSKKVLQCFHDAIKPPDADHTNFRLTLFAFHPLPWWERALQGLSRGIHFLKSTRSNLVPPFVSWSGHLVPYQSSDRFRSRRSSRWRVSDEQPRKNEGVAGRVFGEGTNFEVDSLPDSATIVRKKSAKAAYAQATNCSDEWLTRKINGGKGSEVPRAFWATPIDVDGESWGVLLVDSTLEHIKKGENFEAEAAMAITLLATILPGGQE